MVLAMRWIPTWLAEKYSILYFEKQQSTFEFNEAKEILGIEDKRKVADIISRLRGRGFLISRRDPVDPRRKLYKLIDPESLVYAFGVQSRAMGKSVEDKLRAVTLEYVVGGPAAAFRYHRYLTPGKMDIYVNPADLNKWIALMTSKGVSLSIDNIPAEKADRTHIHIHSTLTREMSENSVTIDGLRYLNPEILVVQGLEKGDEFSLSDALAILLSLRSKMEWEKLRELAEVYHVVRELGCCMDILNYEAEIDLFSEKIINEIQETTDLSGHLGFRKAERGPFADKEKKEYEEISKKWNMDLNISKASIHKILTDLGLK